LAFKKLEGGSPASDGRIREQLTGLPFDLPESKSCIIILLDAKQVPNVFCISIFISYTIAVSITP
jgi:hypothetical protein